MKVFMVRIYWDLLGFVEGRAIPMSQLAGSGQGVFKNTEVVTASQLRKMFPRAKQELLDKYLPEFNNQLPEAGINTPKRLAYFFATINVETAGMTQMTENDFTYIDPMRAKEFFPKELGKMTNAEIKALGNGEKMANVIYANKSGNGGISSRDGYTFRGRGLFHYTGRENYKNTGGMEYINSPNLILIPSNDVRAAVSYWNRGGISVLAEQFNTHIDITANGKVIDQNFKLAVKYINGGTIGLTQRALSYNSYMDIF